MKVKFGPNKSLDNRIMAIYETVETILCTLHVTVHGDFGQYSFNLGIFCSLCIPLN